MLNIFIINPLYFNFFFGGVKMYPFLNVVPGLGTIELIIIIIGLGLVVLEMFFPGFGAAGVLGLILLLVGIVMTANSLFEALILIIIIIALLGIALVIVLKSASKGHLSKTLILNDALDDESGFRGTEDLDSFVGKEGETITPLRPSGIAVFDGDKLDVVTEGEFIPANTRVKIIEVSGRRIVVRKE